MKNPNYSQIISRTQTWKIQLVTGSGESDTWYGLGHIYISVNSVGTSISPGPLISGLEWLLFKTAI